MNKETTTAPASAFTGELRDVPLADILPDASNKLFRDDADMSEAALKDLTDSIVNRGVIQPVLLRRDPDNKGKFVIVAGERRFTASCYVMSVFKARTTIPAYIKDITAAEALELQIIENLQREGINPMREALGFDRLVKERKLTTASIAAKIGKSIDYVQERMRLSHLIKPLQDLVRAGDIPLKAGLKYAMIPEKDQEDAMGDTTEIIDLGEKGKSRVIFAGLDKLQEWMDNHLFIDLKTADFDKEDPKLNPAMGPCSTCIFRTKNTGGLFDDITLVDECTKAACFRTKQVNTYAKLKEDLKKKFPKAKIIFKKRSNNIEGLEVYRKHLVGEIKGAGAGQECSEKDAQKAKGSELAILIGVDRYKRHNKFSSEKKFVWIKPSEMSRGRAESVSSSTVAGGKSADPEKAAQAEQKRKDENAKENYKRAASNVLDVEEVMRQYSPKLLRLATIHAIILNFENGDVDEMLATFKALDVDWLQEVKRKMVLIKAKDADLAKISEDEDYDYPSDKELIATLQAVSDKKLQEIFFVSQAMNDYQFRNKHIKQNRAEVAKKANAQIQSWWAKELEKRKKDEVGLKQNGKIDKALKEKGHYVAPGAKPIGKKQ